MAGEIRISCDAELQRLINATEQTRDAMERLSPVPILIDMEYYGWQLKQINGKKTFSRIVTLVGSTMSIELPISRPISLERTELWFNSGNARTHNIRMHSQINPSAYTELDAGSATTASSRFVDFGEGYVYLTPTKLVFNFSSYTADDKVNLQVQLTEL